MEYNDLQLLAIRTALTAPVSVITGGPGTGKTTVLRGILDEMEAQGLHYRLCAPTGRAQKRMTEQTGRTAQTIHRLLEWQGGRFGRDEDSPLLTDAVIVDECSMIDLMLMQALLRAIQPGTRLILIGDNDQLPSVGAGRVLGDIIDSGVVPVTRLTQIYRQSDGSYITQNARAIIRGRFEDIHLDNRTSRDFFFLDVKSLMDAGEFADDPTVQTIDQAAQRKLIEKVSDGLPRYMPGREIQVLTPTRQRGECSTDTLNPLLQHALNPDGQPLDIAGYRLRRGDRVMQMRNNYALGAFNGDIGQVDGVGWVEKKRWRDTGDWESNHTDDDRCMLVRYPDHPTATPYDSDDLKDIDLAYASTIHKAQGSEYPIVVIMITPATAFMLNRNLLYTAVTRAKDLCLIIGDRQTLRLAVRKVSTDIRQTRLATRLRGETDITDNTES